jgi:hypothetical protein
LFGSTYLTPAWWLGLWILTPASLYALTALWLASAGTGFTLAGLIIRGTDSALHGDADGVSSAAMYIYLGVRILWRVS